MIAKLVQITVLFLGSIKQQTYLGGPTWYGDLNGISSNMKISTTEKGSAPTSLVGLIFFGYIKNLQAVHFYRKNDDWPFDLGTSDLYGYVYARPALRWDRNLANW